MKDEQLLKHSPEEARQKFSDDQLERYNELKQGKLEEDIDQKQTKDSKTAVEGLNALRESVENELTVTVRGIEFKADINQKQIKRLHTLSKFEDRKEEDLSPEESDELMDNMLNILSDLSVNYDKADWEQHFGDAGVVTLATITFELVDQIEEFMQQKKSR